MARPTRYNCQVEMLKCTPPKRAQRTKTKLIEVEPSSSCVYFTLCAALENPFYRTNAKTQLKSCVCFRFAFDFSIINKTNRRIKQKRRKKTAKHTAQQQQQQLPTHFIPTDDRTDFLHAHTYNPVRYMATNIRQHTCALQ